MKVRTSAVITVLTFSRNGKRFMPNMLISWLIWAGLIIVFARRLKTTTLTKKMPFRSNLKIPANCWVWKKPANGLPPAKNLSSVKPSTKPENQNSMMLFTAILKSIMTIWMKASCWNQTVSPLIILPTWLTITWWKSLTLSAATNIFLPPRNIISFMNLSAGRRRFTFMCRR